MGSETHKPLVIGRAAVIDIDLARPRSWRDEAYNFAQFDAWDRAQRQRYGWRAGLAFWGKTNEPGSRVLVSRHWPHLLCWSWSIWVGQYRGVDYDGPRKFILNISRRYRTVELKLFGPYVRLSWQNYGYMGHGAPQILWQHHLRNAEVAGNA